MRPRLAPSTILLLTVPPLLWAGNAVVGRTVRDLSSPMLLNFLRWALAFLVLLPLAHRVLRRDGPLWPQWRRYAVLGLLGVGCYNALQYLALQTSTPINVTLVGSSMPLWMLATGALFFRQRVRGRDLFAALLSMAGVLIVLARGEWAHLAELRLVRGDLYMLLATCSWACYSWMLARMPDPEGLRGHWAAFLLAQITFGLCWSGAFAAGEWAGGQGRLVLGWPTAAALAFIALGPAVLAYRCWGAGVMRAGPSLAGFFQNLTPLFAALLSALFLGEGPQLHQAVAFVLIVASIAWSSGGRAATRRADDQ